MTIVAVVQMLVEFLVGRRIHSAPGSLRGYRRPIPGWWFRDRRCLRWYLLITAFAIFWMCDPWVF